MGWPSMDTSIVEPKDVKSMIGEGMHLGCLAMCMNSVFMDPLAPWWARVVVADFRPDQGASSSKTSADKAPKRTRRVGPVRSLH